MARKEIFAELPRTLRNNCQKIIDGSKNIEEQQQQYSQTKTRFWYPENIFGPIVQQQQQECEILEPSICLSFLKNYSDVEDEIVDDKIGEIEKQKTDDDTADKRKEKKAKKKKKRKRKRKDAKISDNTKEKKRKRKKSEKIKRKKLKKNKTNEECHSPPIENEKLNDETEAECPTNELKKTKEFKKKKDSPQHKKHKTMDVHCETNEINKKKERSPPPFENKRLVEESLTPETKPKIKHRKQSEDKRHKRSDERPKNKSKSPAPIGDSINIVKESLDDDLPVLNENATTSTPDTDEYHSLWESDEEAAVLDTNLKKERLFNNSWESDEEQFDRSRRRSPERCLEMPLNIKSFSRRDHAPIKFSLFAEDSWEKETIGSDEVRRLEEERRTISEERRLLQLERKKLEELERKRYFTNITPEKILMEKERSASPFYKKTIEMEEEPLFKRNRDHVTYSRKEKKSRWNEPEEETKKHKNETELISESVKKEKIELPSPQVKKLENEYEEFMKAVSSETSIEQKTKKTSSSSSSSSSSASSTSSSSTSSSESSVEETKNVKKKKKKRKKKVKKSGNFDEFVLEPKQATDDFNLLPKVQTSPKPVPTPETSTDKVTTTIVYNCH